MAMSFARKVISGTTQITLSGVCARLLSFASVPLLSHLLGPEPYGAAALAASVISIGSTLALLGIDMAYARFYLHGELAQRVAAERFCWRFAVGGGAVSAGLAAAGWLLIGERWLPTAYREIALYSGCAILLAVMATMATTRARLEGGYRKLAIGIVAAAIVSILINLAVAMYWRADEWALLLGVLGSSLCTLLLLGVPARATLLKKSDLTIDSKRGILAFGIVGSITAPMYWLISSSDRWFLAEYANASVIGIYAMSASLAFVGQILNSSLTLTWFPEAARMYQEHSDQEHSGAALVTLGRLWERLLVGLAVVWLAVSAAGGDVLRLLAAPQFHAGAPYIPWLAAGVFFYGLAGLSNTVFFLKQRMGVVAWYWVMGALVNLILNAGLVPYFAERGDAAQGAAIAQVSSFAVIALGILAASRRFLPMPINSLRLGLCFFLVLLSGLLMQSAWSSNPVLSLGAKLPIGLLVTVAVGQIIAPDWIKHMLVTLRRSIGRRKV